MTRSPSVEIDRLLEAAWHSADAINWGLDALAANDVFTDEHTELGYIAETGSRLRTIAQTFTTYSDGRPIRTSIDIETGHTFVMIWPAEPNWAVGEEVLIENRLTVDPGQRDRGGYRVLGDTRSSSMRVEALPPTLSSVTPL